jgi:hypothetical protein
VNKVTEAVQIVKKERPDIKASVGGVPDAQRSLPARLASWTGLAVLRLNLVFSWCWTDVWAQQSAPKM